MSWPKSDFFIFLNLFYLSAIHTKIPKQVKAMKDSTAKLRERVGQTDRQTDRERERE